MRKDDTTAKFRTKKTLKHLPSTGGEKVIDTNYLTPDLLNLIYLFYTSLLLDINASFILFIILERGENWKLQVARRMMLSAG